MIPNNDNNRNNIVLHIPCNTYNIYFSSSCDSAGSREPDLESDPQIRYKCVSVYHHGITIIIIIIIMHSDDSSLGSSPSERSYIIYIYIIIY